MNFCCFMPKCSIRFHLVYLYNEMIFGFYLITKIIPIFNIFLTLKLILQYHGESDSNI